MRHENFEREMKLVGLRTIFGVEHRDELAASERQCGIECLRLGARAAIGRDDDLERRTELQAGHRVACFEIVKLNHQFDLQLFAG